jgi:AraC-like DNA-binding protein
VFSLAAAASTVSIRLVSATLSAARAVDSERLLQHCGLIGLDLADPDVRVPAQRFVQLLRLAAHETADPHLGFHAGAHLRSGDFGVVEYAARSSNTLREFFGRVARFHRLIGDCCEVRLSEGGDGLDIAFDWPADHAESRRQMAEFAAAALVALGREATGSQWVPQRLGFRHKGPRSEELHAWFGTSPVYAEATSHLILPPSLLDARLRRAEPGLAAVLDRLADELLARLPEPEDLPLRVRYAVSHQLWSGECSLESVARGLCMSPRSLQRRLQDCGTSFNALVDNARREAALELILDPALSVSDLATRVGFSEPSAFDRAFRRWTGNSPSHYRRLRRTLPSHPTPLSS